MQNIPLVACCLPILWFSSFPMLGLASYKEKRALIWPSRLGVVQAILGAGIPVDTDPETVIVGFNVRGVYGLIRNSTWITNPGLIYARRKRASTSRWNIYKYLAGLAELYGYGGKSCVLRTICEMSSSPIDKNSGLIEEMIHVLFTPSTTKEDIGHHLDNEYHAAQHLGSLNPYNCGDIFSDCKHSFLEMFTIFS